MKRIVCAALCFATLSLALPERAIGETYAIIIGNNAPPKGSKLSVLKYADDDAIRYYRFFKRLTDHVHLLTVADQRTQRRYPGIGDEADTPTLHNLSKAIAALKPLIQRDEAQGKKTTLYLAYSGHGDYAANGEPYLTFLDGGLDGRRLYEEILADIKTDYQHVFIDACYAEGVVGFRGPFDNEVNSDTAVVSPDEKTTAFGAGNPGAYPGLGVVISSAKNETTHEWSRFESGVFTHEVLSGLSGPADINHDGKIEYSELVAFISVANLEVKDTRGKLDVIAKPPARNQTVPIVNLTELKNVAYLTGDPSKLGHFSIELKNGLRYLDANLTGMNYTHIAIPLDTEAYLYTSTMEAELKAEPNRIIELARLDLEEKQTRTRGGIEDSLRDGLFAATYGQAYYQGFVDSAGFVGVAFNAPPVEMVPPPPDAATDGARVAKPIAIASFALAGAAAISAATFGILALTAKKEHHETNIQKEATDANKRYMTFGTATWVAVGILPVALVTGILLWPKETDLTPPITVSGLITNKESGLTLTVNF